MLFFFVHMHTSIIEDIKLSLIENEQFKFVKFQYFENDYHLIELAQDICNG